MPSSILNTDIMFPNLSGKSTEQQVFTIMNYLYMLKEQLMLYDITHLTRTEIQNRSQPRRSTNPSPGTASYTATDSDNSISAEDKNVNARFSVDEDYEREDVPDYFRGNPYWLETEHAAKAAGYPEIDGVQINPVCHVVSSSEKI